MGSQRRTLSGASHSSHSRARGTFGRALGVVLIALYVIACLSFFPVLVTDYFANRPVWMLIAVVLLLCLPLAIPWAGRRRSRRRRRQPYWD